jgi:hypothetical protein
MFKLYNKLIFGLFVIVLLLIGFISSLLLGNNL